jgi:hypothetical protein
MDVLAYDVRQNPAVEALNIPYHDMDYILERADVISLHVPLLPSTYHLINKDRSAHWLSMAYQQPASVLPTSTTWSRLPAHRAGGHMHAH